MRPERNGTGDPPYCDVISYSTPKIFTVESNDIHDSMGLLPKTLLNMPSRKRGYHPLCSFTAAGKYADELIRNQSPMSVYMPFQKLCELQGYVLLMGVNLTRATIIHYAEQRAGRNPFLRWALDMDGNAAYQQMGGCSSNFDLFGPMLAPIEKNITVGQSLWRCFPANEMADICARAIKENPNITHCGNPNCDRCNDAVQGGPIII
jgi:aminoglycoside 3-N-acetyltransferase